MTSTLPRAAVKRSLINLLCLGCFVTTQAMIPSASLADPIQSAAATTSSLQGSVKVNRIQTEVGLKDLLESVKELRRISLDLIGEIERHDMVVMGEPDVIGPIVMPAIPTPSGTMQLGDALAPRPKWLDFYMSQLGQLIPFLKKEEKSVVIPADIQSELNNHWTEIRALTKDIVQHYENLKPLTAGPNFDNLSIGREALGIYDDTSKFDKPLKDVYQIVRK